MTIQELEQVIQEYFLSIYKKKYLGKLEIKKLSPVGYCIKFGMDRPTQPSIIYAELDDCNFLKYLKQQIKDMRLNLIYYGELSLINPHQNEYEKGRTNIEN